MNILVFVLALIMMFAITTSTMLQKSISNKHIASSFKGYMQSSRNAFNAGEYELHKQKGLAVKDPDSSSSDKKKTAPISGQENEENKPRVIKIHYGKINIHKLIVDEKDNQKELYKMFTSLIYELYHKKSFYKTNLEKRLAENIISALKNQKKQSQDLCLKTLVLQDASLQKIYYKMLKGTKYYNYEKNKGIACLLDYIKINSSNSKIPMKNASFELLVSQFGKELAKEIKEKQSVKKPENFTFDYILSRCKNLNIISANEEALKLFDFSKNSSKDGEKILVGLDDKTDIKVKLSIPGK